MGEVVGETTDGRDGPWDPTGPCAASRSLFTSSAGDWGPALSRPPSGRWLSRREQRGSKPGDVGREAAEWVGGEQGLETRGWKGNSGVREEEVQIIRLPGIPGV